MKGNKNEIKWTSPTGKWNQHLYKFYQQWTLKILIYTAAQTLALHNGWTTVDDNFHRKVVILLESLDFVSRLLLSFTFIWKNVCGTLSNSPDLFFLLMWGK